MNPKIEQALQRIETGMATEMDAERIRAHIAALESTQRVMPLEALAQELGKHSIPDVSCATGVSVWTLYDIKAGRTKRGFLDWSIKLTDYFLDAA